MSVATILSLIRKVFPDAIILHYMDDILICSQDKTYLNSVIKKTVTATEDAGFHIAPEKIQYCCPWKYLRFLINERTIVPQGISVKNNPQTLRGLQQLCRSITWIRPLLGLTTELSPLFNLLKGSNDLSSQSVLTPEALDALQKVAHAVSA